MECPNPLPPDQMTTDERLAEVCEVLARGVVRLHARQSRQLSDRTGESCLHSGAHRSGHANPNRKGVPQ